MGRNNKGVCADFELIFAPMSTSLTTMIKGAVYITFLAYSMVGRSDRKFTCSALMGRASASHVEDECHEFYSLGSQQFS